MRSWQLPVGTLVFILLLIGFSHAAHSAQGKVPESVSGGGEAGEFSVSTSLDIFSQYVFRGVASNKGGAVIEPSVSLGYKGLSFSVWGNLDANPANGLKNWTETDVVLSYSHNLTKNLDVRGGAIYYFLENASNDAIEVFGGATYHFPWFNVSFTAYKEVTHYPGWWLQFDVNKTIPLPYYGMSLFLDARFGYQILYGNDNLLNTSPIEYGNFSDLQSGLVMAALNIPFKNIPSVNTFYVTPVIGVAYPLSTAGSHYIAANSVDNQDTHIFGGVSLLARF